MLISEILEDMSYTETYKIVNEQSFEYLSLTVSELEQSCCVFLDSIKYINTIGDFVSMVITKEELVPELINKQFGLCIVENPREFFFEIHNFLSDKDGYAIKTFETSIGVSCNISSMASIAKKNVKVGNNVTVEEFVVIRENTTIGDNTIIRAGCKIGGQGYEFKRNDLGISSVAHVGGVKIGSNVEIQYNTCVDRGVYPWDDTVVGDFCKIDNLVHIAHGVKLDKNIMVVANTGIGGRTVVKEGTWLGFGTTISNGIMVGKNASANIGSVVTKSIPDNASVTGNFAIDHSKFLLNLKKSLTDGA